MNGSVRYRWLLASVVGVALAFLLIAVPGSPVAALLARALTGSGRETVLTRSPGPAPQPRPDDRPELRAAVGAMISPRRTYLQYRRLFGLLAKRSGRRLRFVQRGTYAEVNDLLAGGKVDVAWVCTGALEDLRERNGASLLAVPVVGGKRSYRAYVIARSPGRIHSLDDLRGTRFAFTDPLSLTGRRVVVDWLASRGETVEGFFDDVFFTHAHDNSVRAVRRGLADAATVDSLVYDWLRRFDSEEVAGTSVIWVSPPLPIPPIVVSTRVDPALREQLAILLGALEADPQAQPLLRAIGVDRFVKPDPSLYWPG
ncbi:MAG: PhnD/SsuA/transferrin family substrate-binding protein [Acidobacteria bacterium]|nr:PhnD/SsuA/transferrin family substrate-binding protein [Acidobacteriota bacterium]